MNNQRKEEGIENCTCGEYKLDGTHRYNGHPCLAPQEKEDWKEVFSKSLYEVANNLADRDGEVDAVGSEDFTKKTEPLFILISQERASVREDVLREVVEIVEGMKKESRYKECQDHDACPLCEVEKNITGVCETIIEALSKLKK